MTRTLYDLTGANDLRFSPNCWRSRMALAHKRLEVDCEPCRFTEKEKIAFSGQTRVPVLRDGDTVVSDSWEIACYLEDAYPDRPSLFGGPEGRGATRLINEWANAALHPGLIKVILYDVFTAIDPADRDYFRETREKRFGMTLEAIGEKSDESLATFRDVIRPLDATLADQTYICGEAPAYGDYIVFGAFQWARACSDKAILTADQPLYAWRERMLDLFDGLARQVPARGG